GPGYFREQRVIAPEPHVEARKELRPALPDENAARLHRLAAERLDAEILGIAVTPVTGGAAAFVRGHCSVPRLWSFVSRKRTMLHEIRFALSIASRGVDAGDPNLCITLPVAFRPPVVLPALLLENHDRAGSPVLDDLRHHTRALDNRLADQETVVAVDQPNPVQFDRAADFAGQRFHLQQGPRLDTILFATGLYDRIHMGMCLRTGHESLTQGRENCQGKDPSNDVSTECPTRFTGRTDPWAIH